MNVWLIIGLVILGLGFVCGIICEPSAFFFCLPVLALEGIVYGLIKLPAWVLGWTCSMFVKVAFMAMPYLIVIGIILFFIGACTDKAVLSIIGGIIVLLGIIAGIVALVWGVIPSTAWRITAIIFIPLIIAFVCVCAGEMGGGSSSNTEGGYGLLSDGYGSEQC